MYFGTKENYLSEIAACDFGYELGRDSILMPEHNYPKELIPQEFKDFMAERLPLGKNGALSWITRISDITNSEEEAWTKFKDLWEEFKESKLH